MQVVLKTCVSACFLWGLDGKIGVILQSRFSNFNF